MDNLLENRELVSALADGQLRGAELARAIELAAGDTDAQQAWHAYHLVGDVLRSGELASLAADDAFMARLQSSLARESIHPAVPAATVAPATLAVKAVGEPAANEPAFRWKLVAGFASLAAVGAVSWSLVSDLPGADSRGQLARVAVPQPPVAAVAAAQELPAQQQPAQQQVTVAGSPQVMIRDPRLDELLSAHRQFGGTSALQMPAGFLRNATFESPDR